MPRPAGKEGPLHLSAEPSAADPQPAQAQAEADSEAQVTIFSIGWGLLMAFLMVLALSNDIRPTRPVQFVVIGLASTFFGMGSGLMMYGGFQVWS